MPRYTQDSRERVRDAVDFSELVGARTELRRAGVNRLVGLCPFHEERSPSFGIDPVEKLYHCFGCGAGGDVFKFVMETESVGFGEALEILAERYGVELERDTEDPRDAERRARRDRLLSLLERTAAYYVRQLWEGPEAAGAREYLASRGLDEGVLREFRVGYSPSAWDRVLIGSQRAGFSIDELLAAGLAQRSRDKPGQVYDRFRGRLMFPLCDSRGRVLGFGARALREGQQPKYVNSAEGEIFHKGRMVFGTHLARVAAAKDGSVILSEGYTDVIALHQAGLRNAVGLMGTALTDQQAGELARLAGTVVLCLDADAAGLEAMRKASEALSKAAGAGRAVDVRVAGLPPGADPADLLATEGPDGIRSRIAGAVPLARWQVERALETGDLGDAEGRDRVLAAAGAVIRELPQSVLREELVQLVAGRLGLSEGLVAAALREAPAPAAAGVRGPRDGFARRGGGRGERERGRGGAIGRRDDRRPTHRPAPSFGGSGFEDPFGDGRPPFDPGAYDGLEASNSVPVVSDAARQAMDRRAEAERAFLALCIAVPEEGRRRLAETDLDAQFAAPVDRRAAAHLLDHADHPATGIPEDDPQLSALIAELVMRARMIENPTRGEMDRASLHLELARLDRGIAAARIEGGPVGELAAERQRVLAELRRLTT